MRENAKETADTLRSHRSLQLQILHFIFDGLLPGLNELSGDGDGDADDASDDAPRSEPGMAMGALTAMDGPGVGPARSSSKSSQFSQRHKRTKTRLSVRPTHATVEEIQKIASERPEDNGPALTGDVASGTSGSFRFLEPPDWVKHLEHMFSNSAFLATVRT